MTKTNTLIRLFFYILFGLTPLIFTSINSELFETPKMYFVYGLTLVIVTLHLISYVKSQSPLFVHTTPDFPLILFLISQIISTIISADPHTSFFGYYSRLNGGLLSTIAYLLLYWTAVVHINSQYSHQLIKVSLFSGFLVAFWGILQHFGIDAHLWVQDVRSRVFSTLGQPNWLAAYLCILLPLSIYQLHNSKNIYQKIIYLFLTSTLYIGLLFTKSKSGIAASLFTLFPLLLIQFSKQKFKVGFSYLAFLLIAIFSLTIDNPIKNIIIPPSSSSQPSVPNSTINITPSEDIRKIVWQGALDLWQKYPLFGTGTETFAYSYYWTRPASHNLTSEWDFLYNKAHNEYINFLATTGTFGLLSYSLLIIAIIYQLLKNSNIKNLKLNFYLLLSFLSILITNFFGFSVVITSLFFFLSPSFCCPLAPKSPHQPKNILPFLPLFALLIFLFSQVTSLYLADISYAQSERFDSAQQYSSALDSIDNSLRFSPRHPLYLAKKSNLSAKLALISSSKDRPDQIQSLVRQTIDYSDKSLHISPANINFWKERAQSFYYLSSIDSKYFINSIEALTKASALAPTDAKIYYLLGSFLSSAQQFDQAVIYYRQAIDLKPNYDHAYFELGQIYFGQQQYSKAKEMFESTLKIAPNNLQAKELLDKITSDQHSIE